MPSDVAKKTHRQKTETHSITLHFFFSPHCLKMHHGEFSQLVHAGSLVIFDGSLVFHPAVVELLYQ